MNNPNNKEKRCEKCKGAGWYQYSGFNGDTPHSTICDECCTHDKGFWELKEYYGKNNDKMCCLNGCGFIREKTKDDIAIPQSVEKRLKLCPTCNTMKNMEFGTTECRQCFETSNTLGTTMEERFKEEFPMLSGVKVTPDRDSDFEKAKILQQYWNNIEKNLKDFINKELSQSKAETIKECIEKINKYWRFDNDQQPLSSWHEKQDLINLLSKDIEQ